MFVVIKIDFNGLAWELCHHLSKSFNKKIHSVFPVTDTKTNSGMWYILMVIQNLAQNLLDTIFNFQEILLLKKFNM